ncbi:MAG: hypothetical protein P0S95_08005 [Rhabdochlamydiaceae bacterium]|nr:hypothetical protein [Candidatus Amphrikana amoebophyrae]
MSALFTALEKESTHYSSEEEIASKYSQTIRSFLNFHSLMLITLVAEVLILSILLNFSFKSYAIAIDLAFILITLFSYLICNYYLQTKMSEQLIKLRNNYLFSLREEMGDENDHLSTSKAIRRLIAQLKKENLYYKVLLPQKICHFLVHNECHFMLETLYLTSVNEIHLQIKKSPLDLKAHTALSNLFIEFSKIFSEPEMKQKYEKALKMAIEELQILDNYAPNDPWIHARLASCYHLLNDKEKETQEYELLRNLCPEDPDVLFKLGKLYFEQGNNAKGMRVYDKLKAKNDYLANKLIATYDISIKYAFSQQ